MLDLAQETVAKEAGSAGDKIDAVVGRLRQAVRSGTTRNLAWRRAQLEGLVRPSLSGSQWFARRPRLRRHEVS